jgi:hypothetical protein
MDIRQLAHLAAKSLLFILICTAIPKAHAECSDAHMRNLKERGKSITDIAQQCGMSKADVSAVLVPISKDHETADDEDDGDEVDQRRTLPSGTPIQGCGCWGFVALGAGQLNPVCSSGYEHAVPCAGMCPAGGAPWARVCQ